MEQQSDGRKLTTGELVGLGIGGIMVVLYIAIGTTIIFRTADIRDHLKSYNMDISTSYAKAFGFLLILYGIYRGYKVIRRYFFTAS